MTVWGSGSRCGNSVWEICWDPDHGAGIQLPVPSRLSKSRSLQMLLMYELVYLDSYAFWVYHGLMKLDHVFGVCYEAVGCRCDSWGNVPYPFPTCQPLHKKRSKLPKLIKEKFLVCQVPTAWVVHHTGTACFAVHVFDVACITYRAGLHPLHQTFQGWLV